MEIRFTDHAIAQLQERNLTKAAVIQTVRTNDNLTEQSPNRFRSHPKNS